MAVQKRNHDCMMVAWVLCLHAKHDAVARMLKRAAALADSDTPVSSTDFRQLLANADVDALEILGPNRLLEDLAVAYADAGCCALLQLANLPGSSRSVWHLVLGHLSGYLATSDYREGGGEPLYAKNVGEYMQGRMVVAVKPVRHWGVPWETRLEEVDGL